MLYPVTADRAAGALVAMALGDSLGLLCAGQYPDACADFAYHALSDIEPPWLERGGIGFGQYAADTQLAFQLGVSIHTQRGFSPADFAARIADLARTRTLLAPGHATAAAAARLASGMAWAQAGEAPPAAGNGAAVRAVPLGLTFQRADFRAASAALQARITHHDPRAHAAAQCVAEAVFQAATVDDAPGDAFLERLSATVEPLDPRLAHGVRTLRRALSVAPEAAYTYLAGRGFDPNDGFAESSEFTGFSTPSILLGLYAFMTHPHSAEDAIALALAAGGDTASHGALAGALVGAHLGWTGLGERLQAWSAHLDDHGDGGRDALIRLAQRLVAH